METPVWLRTRPYYIKINLSDLYGLGHLDVKASTILETILKLYNVSYKLLINESPDIGIEYLTNDNEFVNAMNEAYMSEYPADSMLAVIMDYARKRDASAVIELYDGYEHAWALVFEEE
jgi:hypothetical protein